MINAPRQAATSVWSKTDTGCVRFIVTSNVQGSAVVFVWEARGVCANRVATKNAARLTVNGVWSKMDPGFAHFIVTLNVRRAAVVFVWEARGVCANHVATKNALRQAVPISLRRRGVDCAVNIEERRNARPRDARIYL